MPTISILTPEPTIGWNLLIKKSRAYVLPFQAFFKDFRTLVACLRIEQDSKALECFSKISVFSIGTSADAQYSRLLTPYAAKLVREQLEKRTKVKIVDGKVTTAETLLDECSFSFIKQ